MSSTPILPGPFCGAQPHWNDDGNGANWIECPGCGASTNQRYSLMDDSRPQLADQWNRCSMSPITNFDPATIARAVCRSVAELGDRNSPADQPDMMLVDTDELFAIVIEAFAENADIIPTEGGRESVEDALAVVESFGPGTAGVNDTFARQILLAAEVKRLRGLYESAVQGRADMRAGLRNARAPAAEQGDTLAYLYQLSRTSQDGSMEDGPWDVVLADEVSEPVPHHYIALAARSTTPSAAVPDGWRLVPIEPTEGMCAAAVKYANGSAVYKNVAAAALKIEEAIYGEAYAAMLAAAPVSPNTASGERS